MSAPQPSILHVSQPTDGGVCRCVRELVADQLRRGWNVAVASPRGQLEHATHELGATHFRWPAGRAPGPWSALETLWLRQLLADHAFGLVHLHSSKAGLAGRLAIRGRLPTVFQPHGWSFYPLHGALRRAAVTWERFGARWAHAILCVSESERKRGERAGIHGRWAVVPNGVDPGALRAASAEDRAEARERLGLAGAPLVVCLGRICPAKGQDLLVEAWPRVTGRIPEAQLVLVGGSADGDALRQSAGDHVAFVGERSDVADWLAAADVVAAPSRWEGMSFAMLEAMASARSVVMTDVPGARDALGADASSVVPLGDLRALAAAIIERLLNPELAAEEGAAARGRVERFHDLRASTEAVADLYGRVLEGLSDGHAAPSR